MNQALLDLDLDQLEQVYDQTIDNIEAAYQNGELTEEEAEILGEEATEDLVDTLEAQGYDLNDDEGEEYDGEEYAVYDGDLAQFSAGNDFGQALMAHIVAIDPEDPEATIVELAQLVPMYDSEGYQVDVEEAALGILGLMSGEYVPDDNLILSMAEVLGADREEAVDLLELGAEARESEGVYLDEEETEEDNPEEAVEQVAEVVSDVAQATEENYSRLANLEAKFAAQQEAASVNEALNQLEGRAYALVDDGRMPPHIYEDTFGYFESDSDRLAAFSACCQQNNTNPEIEVYKLEGLVQAYEKLEAPLVNFNRQSYQPPVSPNEYREMEGIAAQARRNVEARKGSLRHQEM